MAIVNTVTPPPSMKATLCRYIVNINTGWHFIIGIGLGWNVGPATYDPEAFLVRGKPATLSPGIESIFPKVLGCLYISFSIGLFYSSIVNTKDSIRTASLPVLCYHFVAGLDAYMEWNTATVINVDKMDIHDPIIGHTIFCTLNIVAFILAGYVINNNDGFGYYDHYSNNNKRK